MAKIEYSLLRKQTGVWYWNLACTHIVIGILSMMPRPCNSAGRWCREGYIHWNVLLKRVIINVPQTAVVLWLACLKTAYLNMTLQVNLKTRSWMEIACQVTWAIIAAIGILDITCKTYFLRLYFFNCLFWFSSTCKMVGWVLVMEFTDCLRLDYFTLRAGPGEINMNWEDNCTLRVG